MQRKLTVENPSISFIDKSNSNEVKCKCAQTTDLHKQDKLREPLHRLHHESKK
jgi:hypothetical protein